MSHFIYNGYVHPDNEVNLARMNIRYRKSPRGRRLSQIHTMYLQGELIETGAALRAKVAQLIDVYSVDYGNAEYYVDDELTRHKLINSDSISGVHVLQRSWPVGDGAELATKRTFSITLEAEYPDVDSQLVHWQESLQFIGNCGADWELVPTFTGFQQQVNAQQTTQRIIQSGFAVGYSAYVLPPGSLFPALEHQSLRRVSLGSGKQQGQGAAFYPTNWTYYHSSGTYQEAAPTTR